MKINMKIARFLFKMIGCAVLVHGISDAAPATKHADGKYSKPPSSNQRHADGKRADGASANSISAVTPCAPQPSSSNAAGVPKPGPAGKNAVNNPSLPTAGQSPKQARRPGPSPAIIGGPAGSTRGIAAVNGTGMARKR